MEEEWFTELMQLKGSSYHESFQTSLKNPRKDYWKKKRSISLYNSNPKTFETRTLLLFKQVCLQEKGQSIGYIPAVKVPKVTIAMRKREVRLVTLKTVFYQFVFDTGQKKT